MVDPEGERTGRPVRRHVRIEVQLEATFKFPGEEEVFQAVTKNVSLGGVCLKVLGRKAELLARLERGNPRLEISLYLIEDEESINVNVKTAWISTRVGWLAKPSDDEAPLLLGMSFEEIDAIDAVKICDFITDAITLNRESLMTQEERILARLYKRGGNGGGQAGSGKGNE